jgi:hypothetical protein
LLTFKFELVNEIETKCQHQTIPELLQRRHSLSSLRGSEDIEILQIFFARYDWQLELQLRVEWHWVAI